MAYRVFRRWPLFSLFVLSAIVLAAIFAPWITPHNPLVGELRERHTPPLFFGGTANHILGTDNQGRDILSRIIMGARISVMVAAVTLGIGGTFGTVLGLVSGYCGGWVDELLMRLVDVKFAVPLILIALIVASTIGASFGSLLAILAFWIWGRFARQVRAEVLTLKETDYVSLARVAGASPMRIMFRHILPGVMNTVIVVATLQVGLVILVEASLSFLGAGIPPPTPAWGSMVAEGRLYLSTAWWISIIPGLAIGLTVMALNFLGDWLRDRLDPRLRQL
ncbi:MAG: ABC transporter permease [Chloroflexota bacterium]|nr:ABC transporter permease [Chloroflexota bacterium]